MCAPPEFKFRLYAAPLWAPPTKNTIIMSLAGTDDDDIDAAIAKIMTQPAPNPATLGPGQGHLARGLKKGSTIIKGGYNAYGQPVTAVNPPASNLSYGLQKADPDDEETPELNYYIVRDSMQREVGRVKVAADRTPDYQDLMAIPIFKSIWSYYKSLNWDKATEAFYPPGKTPPLSYTTRPSKDAVFILELTTQAHPPPAISDLCKKCKVPGKFVRMSLLCPNCGSFIGGC